LRPWKGLAHFGAGFLGCEHPFDAVASRVAPLFPDRGFGDELLDTFDATIKTLSRQHAYLNFTIFSTIWHVGERSGTPIGSTGVVLPQPGMSEEKVLRELPPRRISICLHRNPP
jgi:hypothetical protein